QSLPSPAHQTEDRSCRGQSLGNSPSYTASSPGNNSNLIAQRGCQCGTSTGETPASIDRPLDYRSQVTLATTHTLLHRQRGRVRHIVLRIGQHLAIQLQVALYL